MVTKLDNTFILSSVGNVVVGSVFAGLQSVGAGAGLGAAGTAVGGAVGGVAGWLGKGRLWGKEEK